MLYVHAVNTGVACLLWHCSVTGTMLILGTGRILEPLALANGPNRLPLRWFFSYYQYQHFCEQNGCVSGAGRGGDMWGPAQSTRGHLADEGKVGGGLYRKQRSMVRINGFLDFICRQEFYN
jgi:hypothetical protein